MQTARHIDDNGYLLVKGCPLSSFGIFDYSAGQLGLGGDPMRIVKVFRPESAVNDPEAIASFMNVPLIDDHAMLSGFQGDADNVAPEQKGLDGILTGNVYYEAPWMRGDLKVFSRKMQKRLAAGKKDLSLGYSCDFEEKPGVWQGQAYEVVQTNLRGNHIALVGEGRVPGARVLDGMCFDHLSFDFPSDKETTTMGVKAKVMDKAARDSAIADVQQLIQALTAAVAELGQDPAAADPAAVDPVAADPVAADPVAADPVAAEPDASPADPSDPTADIEGGDPSDPSDPSTQDPAAPDPAQADPATAGEPQPAEGGSDLAALIAQAQAVLQKLANAAGATDSDEPQPTQDVTEGLQEQSNVQGGQVSTDNADPNAPPADPAQDEGPTTALAQAQDASLRHFYADLAVKDGIYQRLSKVVGAFNHQGMDSRAVFAYGVKKLGIKCADGAEQIAVEAYLGAVEKANTETRKNVLSRTAADSAPASSPDIDQYIAEGGK